VPFAEMEYKSFYELGLIAARASHEHFRELEHTRLIMWAAGNWKKGTKPEQIISLPSDRLKPKPNAPRDLEHARQIAERLLPYFAKKKEA